MWIMMYDAFLSIVSKDCGPGELLVRARREGDIERIFPEAKVTKYTKSDYLFRAVIGKQEVMNAMLREIDDIDYGNFKSAVKDDKLHNAYLDVWHIMARLQPLAPYSGLYKKGRKR